MTLKLDKDEMRSYLLGSLEEEHRAALEESILCDPGIYEEVSALEQELIDEYITNNLSPSERQQFETHFLITAERQKNLRFGRLLRRYLNSQPVIVPPEDIPVTPVRQDEIHAPATISSIYLPQCCPGLDTHRLNGSCRHSFRVTKRSAASK